ncbi:MAG: nucleotide sugar dehydrogenase, partial [Rhodocyclaceae bacterium]|nr:nucleotide sugar dehydrogenase [Rhodocyclaceae bacterium]
VIRELQSYGCSVRVHDPAADADEARHEYGVDLVEWDALPKASAIVATVAHAAYANMAATRLTDKLTDNGVFVDVKSFFDRKALTEAGVRVWRL